MLAVQSDLVPAFASALDDGMRYYNAGQYVNALRLFHSVSLADKNNALSHYYEANALFQLNQHDLAIEEYKMAYNLAPAHGQVSRLCMAALLADEQRRAQMEGRQINKQLLRQMVTNIQADLSRNKKVLEGTAQTAANHRANLEDMEEQKIQERCDKDVEDLTNNPIPAMINGRMEYIPRTDEINDVKHKAEIEIQHARERAQKGARQANDDAARRQLELEKTASNLESQLANQSQHGVKLNALGTNLYVRNYTVEHASPLDSTTVLPPGLVATAKKLILPPGKKYADPQGQQAGIGASSAGEISTSGDVHARLIKR
jgi:tetratricopeptide (TPR) repeat protein